MYEKRNIIVLFNEIDHFEHDSLKLIIQKLYFL